MIKVGYITSGLFERVVAHSSPHTLGFREGYKHRAVLQKLSLPPPPPFFFVVLLASC